MRAVQSVGRRRTRAPEPSVTLPGYNHLDVVTAARRQNDGRPEPTWKALANFAIQVIGRHR